MADSIEEDPLLKLPFQPLMHQLCSVSTVLTAGLRRRLVPPRVVELPVLLLRQAEPLLLHLVDLLLGADGVPGHRQIVPQHGLLLPLPLGPRVLQLGAFWRRRRTSLGYIYNNGTKQKVENISLMLISNNKYLIAKKE